MKLTLTLISTVVGALILTGCGEESTPVAKAPEKSVQAIAQTKVTEKQPKAQKIGYSVCIDKKVEFSSKAKVIKAIRKYYNTKIRETKKMVEATLPIKLAPLDSKEKAEALKKELEAMGVNVSLKQVTL